MNKGTNKVSLRSVARHAGVSIWTASVALQNKPGVSPVTRERVLGIAKELGYAPDARMWNVMAKVRDAKSKDLLPIVWLNSTWEKEAWQRWRFHTPYVEGARERALDLGYKLEEIWLHEKGMTMRRLAKMLYQRGIEGVIIPFPARHIRLDWDHLAGVTIGEALLAPKLHRISSDVNFNFQLALKHLKRLGYRRIGICLESGFDSSSQNSLRATTRDLYSKIPNKERVPPLFHRPYWNYRAGKQTEMVAWLKRHKPEALTRPDDRLAQWQWAVATGFTDQDKETELVAWLNRYKPEVIVGLDNRLAQWVQAAGYRVPDDVGVVHLAVDDDVLDWAGIHSRRREMGVAAVEWLVSLMRYRQFGVPKVPLKILIEGSWQDGRTLATSPTAKTQPAAPRKTGRIAKARSLPR